MRAVRFILTLVVVVMFEVACAKKTAAPDSPLTPAVEKHEHVAPHGGTAVVLGNEACHLEFVLDRTLGKLTAYVMDGEMENYLRISAHSFTIIAKVNGELRELSFTATENTATGEKIGDTACFEAVAEWLKTAAAFDAVLTQLEIRGVAFTDVSFNFPRGNDRP